MNTFTKQGRRHHRRQQRDRLGDRQGVQSSWRKGCHQRSRRKDAGCRQQVECARSGLPDRRLEQFFADRMIGCRIEAIVLAAIKEKVAMARISAGLLMYRTRQRKLQVLLAHPGGPRFENKDEKAWSIPKGEVEPGEDLLKTAKREFEEETGVTPKGKFIPLTPVQQKGGKIVHAWAFEGDCDPRATVSNTIMVEWPPGSGRQIEVPESDRAEFFDVDVAKRKIKAGQEGLIEELQPIVGVR